MKKMRTMLSEWKWAWRGCFELKGVLSLSRGCYKYNKEVKLAGKSKFIRNSIKCNVDFTSK